jgi:WhiB family transcriptional regulator, redox-sensing transcriptional regulator
MAEHQDWREQGACLSADPDLFFPISSRGVSTTQITQAKRICAACPVRERCLNFALDTRQEHGIWGGATADERKRMRRRSRRQTVRASERTAA